MMNDDNQDPDTHETTSEEDASDDSSASEAVETLVAGRDRRSTAANRYDRERIVEEYAEEVAEDDEVNLLFADDENEEDEEFEGSEEGEDAENLDSSSDDEDQGPNAEAGDLEGEEVIQKEEKEARALKRKAKQDLTTGAGLRKKVKIDPTLPVQSSQSTKLSKKKERVSWIPTDDQVARTSLRKQTVAHREITHARLKEDEKQRAKLKAQKEKRERERGHEAPKAMTQADRLAEAERTERRNAKSLNRWEELEKTRAEERAQKHAALKNRTLEGPVVTLWSGMASWVGPRLNKVGGKDAAQVNVVEAKKRGRKPKGYHEQLAAARDNEMDQSSAGTPQDQTMTPAPSDFVTTPIEDKVNPSTQAESVPQQITFAIPQGPDNFLLQGTHEYAITHDHSVLPTPSPMQQPLPMPSQGPPASVPEPPLVLENSTRNLVILQKFDELNLYERDDYGLFFNTRKSTKPVKHNQELCPITSLPARYRDPSTGIGYANSYAYKKLQELKLHHFKWSSMLGSYAGRVGFAARGVPEGFLGP